MDGIEVIYKTKIDHCYHTCPHFSLDGGPSPAMMCGHPDAQDNGYIISHPECDQGFPPKCPLLNDPKVRTQWEKSLKEPCTHNRRTRYEYGFQCDDKCGEFFHEDTPTYRKDEYLSSLWMALHNINAGRGKQGQGVIDDVLKMRDKIGIGIKHENYEELIKDAEAILNKHRSITNHRT